MSGETERRIPILIIIVSTQNQHWREIQASREHFKYATNGAFNHFKS